MTKSSLQAAAEAASRVNAMLIAKGKLKLPTPHVKPKISPMIGRTLGDLFTAEVEINDTPLSARNLLTRGYTQDEICKFSGAAISTRGRYMTPNERQNNADGRPLYLHLQASSQAAINLAVSRIQDIINQHTTITGSVSKVKAVPVNYIFPSASNGKLSQSVPIIPSLALSCGPSFIQDKVFVGLENAPATYPVREKVFGPNGSYLQHIRAETGATVALRGKNSGFIEPISGREAFEPLHIHITHPKLEGLQAARTLALNLIETIHSEYVQWQELQGVQPLGQSVLPIAVQLPNQITYQTQNSINSQTETIVSQPLSYVSPTNILAQPVTTSVFISLATSQPSTEQLEVPLSQYVMAGVHSSQQQPAVSYALTSQPLVSENFLCSSPSTVYNFPSGLPTNVGTSLTQSSNVAVPSATYMPNSVSLISTAYPHLQYSKTDLQQLQHKRKFDESTRNELGISIFKKVESKSLQKNISEFENEDAVQKKSSGMDKECRDKDRDLMPPPLFSLHSVTSDSRKFSDRTEVKKLKSALSGLEAYGSDDSDDDIIPEIVFQTSNSNLECSKRLPSNCRNSLS